MFVTLKTTLDCSPDAAWEAVRSPAVMQRVSAPLMRFDSLEPEGFPARWEGGGTSHLVRLTAFGFVPGGEQDIRISFDERDGARIQTDDGGPTFGLLTIIRSWSHRIAISPAPGGRTLYRDRLEVHGSPLVVLAWPLLWVFWQWRASRWPSVAAALPTDR